MENSLLNNSFFKKEDKYKNNYIKYQIPKRKFYNLIIRVAISVISIIIILIFVKYNNNNNNSNIVNFSIMEIDEDTNELFNSLGFPLNSKELIYSRLEKWGFNLSDIAEIEINPNFKEADLKKYKYSKNTYKDILFSYYENKKNSEIEKNILLYKFLEILKKKEINSFYDFLNYFMILQDLNCLPVNYKGIYVNEKFFVPNHLNQVKMVDKNFRTTLVNEKPFLYLTYHGGKKKNSIHNICKFSRDGYFLGSVLLPFEEEGKIFNCISLRGLLLYKDNLYVTDSFKNNSKIFQFSDSLTEFSNRREYLSTFISQNEKENPLMVHPYGIKRKDEYFYVSSQNTGTVLRFNVNNGKLDKSLNSKKNNSDGVVVKLHKNDEIRGIDFDNYGKCYVANKQTGVQVYDENFNLLKIIPVLSPISIVYDSRNSHILVGSSKSHDIKEYDIHNYELIKVVKHPLLRHVAGISIYGDSIFVVSQKKNKLLEFSLSTSLLKNIIVDDLSDTGERVMVSPT
ncbi:conserved Plasmodium protein, unknown function [Plasmodium gallinaceum]|uniref:Uncharacterized protein n=1 Tax=Plasmodium gallinaceum TaxID=5849 RepID=A0A1J1GZB2_PLAGA|nr:conserved Plasmodium protein, unknown function [Plasmodium gallinaceum]CRG97784.1 conserved Plasmodium protein, unknown function [Plasmodium gallinaceum]